jgi:Protein of unknown function (DUF2442)
VQREEPVDLQGRPHADRELVHVAESNRVLIERAGHESFGEEVHFDDTSMWVDLDDGRRMAVPLAWLPRLLAATAEQRALFERSPRGIHGEALDEDISIAGLLAGHGDQSHGSLVAPA